MINEVNFNFDLIWIILVNLIEIVYKELIKDYIVLSLEVIHI